MRIAGSLGKHLERRKYTMSDFNAGGNETVSLVKDTVFLKKKGKIQKKNCFNQFNVLNATGHSVLIDGID